MLARGFAFLACASAALQPHRVLFSVPINLGADAQFDLAIRASDVGADDQTDDGAEGASATVVQAGLEAIAARFCADRGVAAGIPEGACRDALIGGLEREWGTYEELRKTEAAATATTTAATTAAAPQQQLPQDVSLATTHPAASAPSEAAGALAQIAQLGWRQAMDPSSAELYYVHAASGATSEQQTPVALLDELRRNGGASSGGAGASDGAVLEQVQQQVQQQQQQQ